MRFSVIAALSGLAALPSVDALPVGDWKRMYNLTTSAPSSTPTTPPVCCVTPGVPTHCTECHSHSVAPSAHPSVHPSVHPSASKDHATTSMHHSVSTSVPPMPTAPPSCCISPGVPAGCTEYHSHSGSLSARMDQSAYQLAQKQPAQFLSQYVFQSLLVDEFKFGKGTSGKVGSGSNMISQYVVVPAATVPGGLQPASANQLGIHLNAVVTASGLQKNAITIKVEQFHLTARSIATQTTIDSSGPSADTASKSIHINVNADWGNANNLNSLAQEIGISTDQTVHEVGTKQGYNNPYVKTLVKDFQTKVQQTIQGLLGGNVSVKWQGDSTFPTQ